MGAEGYIGVPLGTFFLGSDTLGYSYHLNGDGTSYAISGKTANVLRLDANVVAGEGAVAVSGAAADLFLGRNIDSQAGVVEISGKASILLRNCVLDSAGNSVDISGLSATLILYVLYADGDSMAVSGMEITSYRDGVLPAIEGTYLMTGSRAGLNLIYPRSIPSEGANRERQVYAESTPAHLRNEFAPVIPARRRDQQMHEAAHSSFIRDRSSSARSAYKRQQ